MDQTQFQKLIPLFTHQLNLLQRTTTRNGLPRKRSVGAGVKPKVFVKPADLLFYILFFVRVYPTFDIAKLIFGLDRSQLHYWFVIGLQALEATMEKHIELPAKPVNSISGVFKKIYSLQRHIIDGTEQPINRPKENQEKYYSGKKKKHTIKRQVIITPGKRLIGISYAVEGKKHDKKLAEESKYLYHSPNNPICITDTGYLGLEHPKNMQHIKPTKRKRKQKLSDWQKEYNKSISSIRVAVEHVICHLKYSKIFSDKLRYRIRLFDDQIATVVGGMYNFKRNF
jgi:hypothetical protein